MTFRLHRALVGTGSQTYKSWPSLIRDGRTVRLVYNAGSQHNVTTTRGVFSRTGANSFTTDETVIDTASVDDASYGVGTDSSLNPLVWVNQRDGTDADTGIVLRRRSGGSWSTLVSPAFTGVRLLSHISPVSGVGLVAQWQSRSDTTLAWGVVISDDDGASWSQVTIETGITAAQRPNEVYLLDVGSSTILGVGRSETGGALMQLTCVGDPSTLGNWTRADTNVTDIARDRGWLVPRWGDSSTIDLYYTDRSSGALRWRSGNLATVLASPTSWGAAVTLRSGGNTGNSGADFGYVHGIQRSDRNLLTFYDSDTGLANITPQLLVHQPA